MGAGGSILLGLLGCLVFKYICALSYLRIGGFMVFCRSSLKV